MSATSRTASGDRRPRTVEADVPSPPRFRAPRHGMSGVVAALQALTLSLAVVILPAITAFLASSGGPGDGTGWGRSVSVGAGFWLLGHGAPITAGGTHITLVPLGLTALAVFTGFASARRSAHTSLAAWVAGTVTYALATTAIAWLSGSATGWDLLAAPLGGAVVGGIGLGLGILARPDAPRVGDLTAWLDPYVPPVARLGMRGGALAVALVVASASVLVGAWVLAGRATSGDIAAGLAPGIAGSVILGLAQLTVLLNLVVWAVAWLVGPGFAVGEGSSFTVTGAQSGPLPSVPLLGALPGDDWANAVSVGAPVVVVLAGVVAGVFVWRRLDGATWLDLSVAALALALTAGLLVAVLVAVASGAVGPGRLSTVGADSALTGLLTAAEIGGGAVLALLWCRLGLRHPTD
ncbi:DUF6350 family protein [Oerskovia flava]|uniref:cell division protein PerM n=1 Tax=Oerskovia flava TaxID=2986422 RepID=UPI00223F2E8B|nr:DUF6350 family protein [Oerskovia sp. JB1-3-2]